MHSSKGNFNIKKETYEDRFARKYWCKKASHKQIKFEKRYNHRKLRRKIKDYEDYEYEE